MRRFWSVSLLASLLAPDGQQNKKFTFYKIIRSPPQPNLGRWERAERKLWFSW